MAEKRISHITIGTVSGCSSGRVTKKRGKGHRLSSQAKYIVNSVREFLEKEKAKQKAALRDRVVKRTAAACGIGVTTVIRLHKEYGDSGGILSSVELKKSTQSGQEEIMVKKHTSISKSPGKFSASDVDSIKKKIGCKEIRLGQLSEMANFDKVTVKVKAIQKWMLVLMLPSRM